MSLSVRLASPASQGVSRVTHSNRSNARSCAAGRSESGTQASSWQPTTLCTRPGPRIRGQGHECRPDRRHAHRSEDQTDRPPDFAYTPVRTPSLSQDSGTISSPTGQGNRQEVVFFPCNPTRRRSKAMAPAVCTSPLQSPVRVASGVTAPVSRRSR